MFHPRDISQASISRAMMCCGDNPKTGSQCENRVMGGYNFCSSCYSRITGYTEKDVTRIHLRNSLKGYPSGLSDRLREASKK